MTREIQMFLSNLKRSLASGSGDALVHSPSQVFKIASTRESLLGTKLSGCLVVCREQPDSDVSCVYQAKDFYSDQVVTLKMLKMQYCCRLSDVRRFEEDARAVAALSHANLLPVREIGRTFTGQPFMITERCQGRSLAAVLAQDGRLAWKRAANLFSQVCDALQYAHDHGVVHGQLKPQCIILTGHGECEQVKITDFAVGLRAARRARGNQEGKLPAAFHHEALNLAYLSPEQCSGSGLEPRSDIYALGTVMYECLTGKRPCDGHNEAEILLRQLAEEARQFSAVAPQIAVPGWFEDVVLKTLQKERARRYRSMSELKAALQNGLRSASTPSPLPAEAPCASAFLPGEPEQFIAQVIGGCYRIESFIGSGGMSLVFRAVQKGTDRLVAVKFLRKELCQYPNALKRFEREARSLGRVAHPNLIAIFDVGETGDGQPYMVTEFLDGRSLKEIIALAGPSSVERAMKVFIQVCDVMEFSHRQGIIHRDLKPANIMLVNQGGHGDVVKVVDFGIVKLDESILSVSQKLTASGEICGSPMYMSPEQIMDDPLDARTDVYSLATVIFEVLCGCPVFGGKNITEVMNKHLKVIPPLLSTVIESGDIPPLLDETLARCLEKRPELRFQSMDELKEALVCVQEALGCPASARLSNRLHSGTKKAVSGRTAATGTVVGADYRYPLTSAVNQQPVAGVAQWQYVAAMLCVIFSTAAVSVGLTLFILNLLAHH